MIIIKVGKRIEYSLKEYRKKLEKVGTLRELNSRKRFNKKSKRRREQIERAKYRNRNEKK